MADYHSLLKQLVEDLPDRAAPHRRVVYDRARAALTEQLNSLDPPLTQAEIDREGRSLEDAIARVEADAPEEAEGPGSLPPAPGMREAFERPEDAATQEAAPFIRRGGRRSRSAALVAGLVLLAVPIAVLAWLWRDSPTPAPPAPLVTAERPGPTPEATSPETKYGERVVGEAGSSRSSTANPAPPSRPTPDAAGSPAQLPATSPPPDDPATRARSAPTGDVAVAQRALIFEENPADPQRPVLTTGRAVWRLDAINGGPGQPLETVIRGQVDLSEAGLSMGLLFRRNTDPALPASHTIELTFATNRQNDPGRLVRDVALPIMRPEEAIRGVPVVGLPVPVKDNVFLIGLSDLKADIDKNLELLLRRNWIELPIRFASGQKAALLFDKGLSGERIFLDAFRQWGQVPPDMQRP